MKFYMSFLYLRNPINQIQDINCKINGRIDEENMLDFFEAAFTNEESKVWYKSSRRFWAKFRNDCSREVKKKNSRFIQY